MEDLRAIAIQARESVTAEQRAAWNLNNVGGIWDDLWCSGGWLLEKLVVAGCGSDVAERICFAVGQRQAHEATSEAIWIPAVAALREYTQRGTWEEPGAELARNLLFQHFGNPIDIGKLLAWVISRPGAHERLLKAFEEMSRTEKLPEPPKTPWGT